MKILHVIASVDPRTGGPAEAVRSLSLPLIGDGHHVEVVSLDDPAAAFVGGFPVPTTALGPSGRYGYTPRLAAWIDDNRQRFDVAVIHGLWRHSSVGGAQAARRSRLPYVVFTHGMLDPWFNKVQPFKRWAKQAFWLAAQGAVLSHAKSVLFTCEEERTLARTSFWGARYRERVTALGVAEPPPATNRQRLAFHSRVPDIGGRRFLLFLSRIHPKKGCDLLVEAFANVATTFPDVDLVVAGPDQLGLRTLLQARAAKSGVGQRVHWVDLLQGDAKWGAFRGAEAFVLPSHSENFGIVVAEAMACRTPVLISNKVNIWREVESSGGGLVESDTAAGTENLLRRFLSLSAEERTRMRDAARAGYERHFQAERAAGELLEALRSAVAIDQASKAHR